MFGALVVSKTPNDIHEGGRERVLTQQYVCRAERHAQVSDAGSLSITGYEGGREGATGEAVCVCVCSI